MYSFPYIFNCTLICYINILNKQEREKEDEKRALYETKGSG